MLRVDEFAQALDSKSKPKDQDFFDELRLQNKISNERKTKDLDNLPDYERSIYKHHVKRVMASYSQKWDEILSS